MGAPNGEEINDDDLTEKEFAFKFEKTVDRLGFSMLSCMS